MFAFPRTGRRSGSFSINEVIEHRYRPIWNVPPTEHLPVVTSKVGTCTRADALGLIPSRGTDIKVGFSAFTARADCVARTPVFRGACKAHRPVHRHFVTVTYCVERIPIARAAPYERSSDTPFVNGPRSLTRTDTLRPVLGLRTRRQVPKGKVRWAAVRPFGLKTSPDAVRLPASSWPYQVARTVCAAKAGEERTRTMKAIMSLVSSGCRSVPLDPRNSSS
jgi:hypothetical protein